jgi:integrase
METCAHKKKKEFDSYTKYAFSETDIKKILLACSDQNDRVMVLIAYRYGLRREDLAGVETNNIDLQNNTISFYEQKKKKIHVIPIESDVMQEIKILITASPKRKYLFSWHNGSTCWRHLQELCKIAGIPIPPGRDGRPFHSFRGTCIKFRQKQGWTVNQCAALIDDTVETVMEHYAKTTPAELSELMRTGVN